MRSTTFAAAALSSAVALVGFAGVANASATVDLVWIDITGIGTDGKITCLKPARRNCPVLGSTLTGAAASDLITLGVIITAGPGSILIAGVDVDYNDVLPQLSVVGFQSFTTTRPFFYFPTKFGEPNNDTDGWVKFIEAHAVLPPAGNIGLGLPAGATAYLGTVTFHKDFVVNFQFEIAVGVEGQDGVTDVLDLADNVISSTTTFNSAFLVNSPTPTLTPTPTPTPTATPTRSRKVAVCHRGKTSFSVSANAVPAHLAHGDTLGACP